MSRATRKQLKDHATRIMETTSHLNGPHSLETSERQREYELAAIQTGIRKEFTQGDLSGDILQDFGTFIDHHNAVEKELKDTKLLLDEATKVLEFYANEWHNEGHGQGGEIVDAVPNDALYQDEGERATSMLNKIRSTPCI